MEFASLIRGKKGGGSVWSVDGIATASSLAGVADWQCATAFNCKGTGLMSGFDTKEEEINTYAVHIRWHLSKALVILLADRQPCALHNAHARASPLHPAIPIPLDPAGPRHVHCYLAGCSAQLFVNPHRDLAHMLTLMFVCQ